MVDLDCSREDSEIHSCFHFTQKTPIQPFLCSTLDDFHQERDYLSTEIFPQLDTLCRARGTYFKAVDLRWDTEEIQSSSHFEPKTPCQHHPRHQHFSSQQLKINLDYINSSFPFFICILGHQYGEFRPENSKLLPVTVASLEGQPKVEKNLYVASKNGYPWVLHEENQNCSLTELEITQAAFLNDPQASFFYFRDCRHIEDKILDTLDEEKQKILSTFSSRTDYEELKARKLKTRIINKGLKVSFFRNLRELGELVLKDWTGVIEQCYLLDSIPKNIGIADESDMPLFSENSSEAWMFPLVVQSFVAAAGLRPCVLVLDGIDELAGTFGLSAQQVKEFKWLPQPLPPQCKIIFTTTSSDLSCRSISRRQDVFLVHCPSQPDSEIRGSILQKHLAMPYKEVPSSQLGNIMGKKLSMLPVFLSVLGSELRTCGVLRDQEECLEEYLEVLSLQELWALVLQRWVQDYSWAIERKASSKRKRAVSPNTPQRGKQEKLAPSVSNVF
ncbi:UNVERIFIED_CONTAM: hypothetical protein FKN15_001793 [Acipenser sinensis]